MVVILFSERDSSERIKIVFCPVSLSLDRFFINGGSLTLAGFGWQSSGTRKDRLQCKPLYFVFQVQSKGNRILLARQNWLY